jgi:hypothetical protein
MPSCCCCCRAAAAAACAARASTGSAGHGASCRARLMPYNMIADRSRASKQLKKSESATTLHSDTDAHPVHCTLQAQQLQHAGTVEEHDRAYLWRGGGGQDHRPARVPAALGPVRQQHQPRRRCNLLCVANTSRVHHQPTHQQPMVAVAVRNSSKHMKSHKQSSAHRNNLQCCGYAPGGSVAAADDRQPPASLQPRPTPGTSDRDVLKQHITWRCNMRSGTFGPALKCMSCVHADFE